MHQQLKHITITHSRYYRYNQATIIRGDKDVADEVHHAQHRTRAGLEYARKGSGPGPTAWLLDPTA
eukprot:6190959-Pleurochrysis_carterae.AAC.5